MKKLIFILMTLFILTDSVLANAATAPEPSSSSSTTTTLSDASSSSEAGKTRGKSSNRRNGSKRIWHKIRFCYTYPSGLKVETCDGNHSYEYSIVTLYTDGTFKLENYTYSSYYDKNQVCNSWTGYYKKRSGFLEFFNNKKEKINMTFKVTYTDESMSRIEDCEADKAVDGGIANYPRLIQ